MTLSVLSALTTGVSVFDKPICPYFPTKDSLLTRFSHVPENFLMMWNFHPEESSSSKFRLKNKVNQDCFDFVELCFVTGQEASCHYLKQSGVKQTIYDLVTRVFPRV